jgi:extracellular elastinolytic metalloproteinase
MSREVDRRNFKESKMNPQRESQLQALAQQTTEALSGEEEIKITKFDSTTGNPARIASLKAQQESGNHIQRALKHVKTIKRSLGFAPGQPDEFSADPIVSRTSSGAATVHLHQQYKGIPIFQANLAVHFNPQDTLEDTLGSTIQIPKDIDPIPKLSVETATLIAAQYIAIPRPDEQNKKDAFGVLMKPPTIDLHGFTPKVIATFDNKPDLPTVLEAGPFQDKIKANLIWFPVDHHLALSWEVVIALPSYQEMYRTLVNAETGEIMYCHQLTKHILARANVYLKDGGKSRQRVDFPLPLESLGVPIPSELPREFPGSWIEKDRTVGNNVVAKLGDRGESGVGSLDNGVLVFDPTDPIGDEQKVLNIFYFNCVMHDFFYLLGFTEEVGNFQKINFSENGIAKDAVDARSHSGEILGTANMATPIDGKSPIMNMGLVGHTNCHTAFDSSVVFHEYMHGVTNRLVGGASDDQALEAPQSGGMGEGWGDYIACTINDVQVVGAWVVSDPQGIRGFPYDEKFPDHFGKIGTGRYDEVHNIGEIWCATLMQMNRNIGKTLALQLVVDALKLSRSNPGFLDMRDSILQALDHMKTKGTIDSKQYALAVDGIWGAFAKFGMGPDAKSNGAQLSGIEADFNTSREQPEAKKAS